MFELALIPAAFIAGVFMFLAPCTLPIVPGYIAFIGGKRVMLNAFSFVVGFSLIFILLGVFAATLGGLVGPYREALGRGAGALIIFFGLTMFGTVKMPFISSEWHIKLPSFLTIGRPESSFLVGLLFALGWSPCIGPLLGTVLLLASSSTTAVQGALLLGVFSVGLGVPFLITAFLLDRVGNIFSRLGGVSKKLQAIGGVLLLILGTLMLTDKLGELTLWAIENISGYDALLNYL